MKPLPLMAVVCVLTQGLPAAEPTFAMPEPVRAASAPAPAATTPTDNPELGRIYREDQDDHRAGSEIDWTQVIPRDTARIKRVKQLYAAGELRTGTDYYWAATVLLHGNTPEDFLLAHELSIVAIIKGENQARWLAAASEDRFLIRIGRSQRFGTQYRAGGNGPTELHPTNSDVTDALRREFNVPPPARDTSRPQR